MRTGGFAALLVAAATLSGCTAAGIGDDKKPACQGFDIAKSGAALGSGERLRAELENAAKRVGPVRLIDITRAAGWSDDWTRMVKVDPGMTGSELNNDAGTHESCWQGLPPFPGSDRHVDGSYLFVKDEGGLQQRPVQAVRWPLGSSGVLFFGDRRALTGETVLIASGRSLTSQP